MMLQSIEETHPSKKMLIWVKKLIKRTCKKPGLTIDLFYTSQPTLCITLPILNRRCAQLPTAQGRYYLSLQPCMQNGSVMPRATKLQHVGGSREGMGALADISPHV
jgi:hypothetical protein